MLWCAGDPHDAGGEPVHGPHQREPGRRLLRPGHPANPADDPALQVGKLSGVLIFYVTKLCLGLCFE